VDIDTDELVLEAVILLRLSCLFFTLELLLELFLCEVLILWSDLLFLISILLLGLESSLLAHDFVEGVWLQVKHSWELHERVELVVDESVKVEDDSLEMENQDVWSLRDQGSLGQIDLLVATITLIVTDDLSFDLLLKRLLN